MLIERPSGANCAGPSAVFTDWVVDAVAA